MSDKQLQLLLPKGRLQDKVLSLLSRVGLDFSFSSRSYRPVCSDPEIEAKILKPQNIASLVALGRHDVGFVGRDWVLELGLGGEDSQLVEVLDLGFNPVRIVAAVPEQLLKDGKLDVPSPMVVASEYENLTRKYLQEKGLDAVQIKAYGATEALPPEDADMIVDNTSTGATLAMNRLTIVDELLRSTTRLVVNRGLFDDEWKKARLDRLIMLIKSALEADRRVLLEMNVSKQDVDAVVAELPCLKAPTISPLLGDQGVAIKTAVLSKETPSLIPRLKALGARDILEYRLEKLAH